MCSSRRFRFLTLCAYLSPISLINLYKSTRKPGHRCIGSERSTCNCSLRIEGPVVFLCQLELRCYKTRGPGAMADAITPDPHCAAKRDCRFYYFFFLGFPLFGFGPAGGSIGFCWSAVSWRFQALQSLFVQFSTHCCTQPL